MSILNNVLPSTSSIVAHGSQQMTAAAKGNAAQQAVANAVVSGQAVVVNLSSQNAKRVASHGEAKQVDSSFEKQEAKEKVEEMLQTNGLQLENLVGYDHVYVANMCKADFWGKSIKDEQQMAQYVKDMVDDIDQKDGFIFNRFYADTSFNGVGIPWEEIL